ncbi:PAS domain-containing protein [Sphingomonas sp.]|uniref:PAS domain-containing protein n=1 Tax=Sphingomonas sp. TaxID=28214 RepID=UPI00286A8695|nr:PAS domain-containing protein [Sphingomonas sp.]
MTDTTFSAESGLVAARNALRDHDVSFRTMADALPQMVWSTLPDGFHDYYNARWYEFTGVPAGSTDGEAWNGMFHPDDQDRAWAIWRHCLETGEPYEIDYRLRHYSGEYRWTIGRALPVRDGEGQIVRWIGTCTDIHETKLVAQQNEILSRELSHRIKNIFAVIAGLVSLSSRQDPGHEGFAASLKHRIAALGRAHEFVRPHSDESRPTDLPESLHGIIRQILEPYPALGQARIVVSGDDFKIDDRGATPIALVIHELATNAAKYGALCSSDGKVTICTGSDGDDLRIEWEETGGPMLDGEPARSGFGTKLMELSVVNQLGGRFDRAWRPEGLAATITVQRKRIAR